MSTTYLHIFIVFFLVSIFIVNNGISADDYYDDNELHYLKNSRPGDLDIVRRGVWSRLFRGGMNTPQRADGQSYPLPATSDLTAINGRIQIIPYDKRTIPLELRKALYAHGIVGRRR